MTMFAKSLTSAGQRDETVEVGRSLVRVFLSYFIQQIGGMRMSHSNSNHGSTAYAQLSRMAPMSKNDTASCSFGFRHQEDSPLCAEVLSNETHDFIKPH